jgi:hypothetical protein
VLGFPPDARNVNERLFQHGISSSLGGTKYRLYTIVESNATIEYNLYVKPQMTSFWEEVRSELHRLYGQDSGKRDRKKMRVREQLAKEFGLNSRTLKGFLNGHQKTLGQGALFGLFARLPALEARYKEATGQHNGPRASPEGSIGPADIDHQLYVQMTLQFDGFDDQPQSATAHLAPGREGVLTVRIGARRLA